MHIERSIAVSTLSFALMINCIVPALAGPNHAQGGREARFDRNHPRRSEVLDRSQNINSRINGNRGNLDGHYRQLKREDRAIQRQAQRDARRNGGHISEGQQAQINREENRLNKQIRRDR